MPGLYRLDFVTEAAASYAQDGTLISSRFSMTDWQLALTVPEPVTLTLGLASIFVSRRRRGPD